MLYSVEHTTKYQYHEQVSLCHNIAALAPRNTNKQTCRAFNIIISPLPEVLKDIQIFLATSFIISLLNKNMKN